MMSSFLCQYILPQAVGHGYKVSEAATDSRPVTVGPMFVNSRLCPPLHSVGCGPWPALLS